MVNEFIDDGASLKEITQHQRCSQVIVHGIVTLLTKGLNHLLGFCVALIANLNALQIGNGIHQFLVTLLGSLQSLVREVYSTTIVSREYEETNGHGRVSLLKQRVITRKELLEGDKVIIRFTHLLAIDGQHIVVHPVFHGGVTHRSLSLCYLALMMGEHQVHATSMDIKLLAQVLSSHSCALAVPTREAITPR